MVMQALWSLLAWLDRIGFWGRRLFEGAVVTAGIVLALSLIEGAFVIDDRRAAGLVAAFLVLYPLLVAWLWSDDLG